MNAVVLPKSVTATELQPGLMMISHAMGPRRVNFYAVISEASVVLFDAGLPGFAGEWLYQSGLPEPTMILISHADADHFGGAASLKRTYPGIVVGAHEKDSHWIESPQSILRERYGCAEQFGVGYSAAQQAEILQACGGGVVIDEYFSAENRLAGRFDCWNVLHVPGHSPGHIALWKPDEGILLLGDAVLGFGIPGCDGNLSMPPTHQFISDYLNTLDRLKTLSADTVLTGHWPPLNGTEFKELISGSQECVQRDLSYVRSCIANGSITFAELLDGLGNAFRAWPEESSIHYFYALTGYLEYLAAKGELTIQNSVIRRS
jgi:glyoxylase-like metal-dependent hydrolase (beta-lactamase superfamily II)